MCVCVCDIMCFQERYRSDCSIAVQLLQCKPSNFVAHKLDTVSGTECSAVPGQSTAVCVLSLLVT